MLPITVWIHSLPVQSTCLISFHSTPALSCNPPLRTLQYAIAMLPITYAISMLPITCAIAISTVITVWITVFLLQLSSLPNLYSPTTSPLLPLQYAIAMLPITFAIAMLPITVWITYAIAMLPITVWITVFLSRLNMAI
ncbi:unnamed protein product [Closterium sp. NIES-64]|nr:unnamed protein product [Closterium sp. NIES-64]